MANTATQSVVGVPSNDVALSEQRKEFFKRVRECGRDSGKGDTSLVRMGLDALDMAVEGVIKPDDSESIYEAFQTSRSEKLGKNYEREASFKVQVSKFRQIVSLGTPFGDDAKDLMERALDLRASLAADDATRKGIKGTTYAFMVDVARKQLADDQAGVILTDEQLRDIALPEAEDKTEVDRLKSVLKTMERIRDGKKDEPNTAMPSPELDQAISAIEARLADLGWSNDAQKQQDKLAALMKSDPDLIRLIKAQVAAGAAA